MARPKILTDEQVKKNKRKYQKEYDRNNFKKITLILRLEQWQILNDYIIKNNYNISEFLRIAIAEKLQGDGIEW